MSHSFLESVVKIAVKHGPQLFCNIVPGGGVAYKIAAIATDLIEDYRRNKRDDDLRADMQAMLQTHDEQVQQQIEAFMRTVPAEIQQALTAYLTHIPDAFRRSLRRPSDPTGSTIPATLALSRPEDLMVFLPSRLPRFRPGDRPLPAVDWELEELIGVGGFGEVWKARHLHMRGKAPVALKFCLDSDAKEVLRSKADVLDSVMQLGRHSGVVSLLNAYLSADPPCLEYEFVEGGVLSGLIQDLREQGRIAPDAANRYFRQVVEIVAHAHRADPPIVHGNLKPTNILVLQGGDGKIELQVADFGIGGLAAARASAETRQPARSRQQLLTEAMPGVYKPLYASPEQIMRLQGEPPDPRDDVHALGVIWYQLLTGDLSMTRVPPDWREQVEQCGLNVNLVKLLASCIASKAEKRPASAVALAEQLQDALLPAAPTPSANENGAAKTHQPGEVVALSLNGNVTMKFAWCPPGTFLMGSPSHEAEREDDETQHRVTLTRGFHLGIHPVTQAQWQAVMGDNPSHFKGEDRPVEQVSWDDCRTFCVKLSQVTGKRFRLPTEAEWEYACRAGTTTPFHFGDSIDTDQVNYNGNYACVRGKEGVHREETTLVGSFPANAWGLFDMHGNVWEWCQDGYGPYSQKDTNDPQHNNSQKSRVVRGGSWFHAPRRCRSAYRIKRAADVRGNNVGFRVVLCLD